MLTKTQTKILEQLARPVTGKPTVFQPNPHGNKGFILTNGHVLFRVENESFPLSPEKGKLEQVDYLYTSAYGDAEIIISRCNPIRETIDTSDQYVPVAPYDKKRKMIPISETMGVNCRYLKWAMGFYHSGPYVYIDRTQNIPEVYVLPKKGNGFSDGYAVICPLRVVPEKWQKKEA